MSDIPSVTPAQLVVPMEIVPFAQMQQKEQAQNAIVHLKGDSSDDPTAEAKEFKGLMPTWMLEAGTAYSNQEKFNSDNGVMGKFLVNAVKLASLNASFAQAVQQLQSFGAVKSWLDALGANATGSARSPELAMFTSMLRSELDHFSTNGNPTQTENERQGEFSIVSQEAAGFQNHAQSIQTTTKGLQGQGSNLLSDEGTVGDFLEQISEGFSQGV